MNKCESVKWYKHKRGEKQQGKNIYRYKNFFSTSYYNYPNKCMAVAALVDSLLHQILHQFVNKTEVIFK